MSESKDERGHRSFEEIMSEPEVWATSLQEIEENGRYEEVLKPLEKAEEWVFVGCGSSY